MRPTAINRPITAVDRKRSQYSVIAAQCAYLHVDVCVLVDNLPKLSVGYDEVPQHFARVRTFQFTLSPLPSTLCSLVYVRLSVCEQDFRSIQKSWFS